VIRGERDAPGERGPTISEWAVYLTTAAGARMDFRRRDDRNHYPRTGRHHSSVRRLQAGHGGGQTGRSSIGVPTANGRAARSEAGLEAWASGPSSRPVAVRTRSSRPAGTRPAGRPAAAAEPGPITLCQWSIRADGFFTGRLVLATFHSPNPDPVTERPPTPSIVLECASSDRPRGMVSRRGDAMGPGRQAGFLGSFSVTIGCLCPIPAGPARTPNPDWHGIRSSSRTCMRNDGRRNEPRTRSSSVETQGRPG
jgi:hypothetical protein